MTNEFPVLRPVMEAILKNKGETLLELLRKMPDEGREKEAEILLKLMDAYEPPKLPFGYITDEEIKKAWEDLKEQYGFVVWSDLLAGSDEDCADLARNNPETYLGYSEDEIREVSMQANHDEMGDLKEQFHMIDINGLIIIGTIGRWDGKYPVSKRAKSLADVFSVFTEEDGILYVKDGQLKAEVRHHDGRNYYTFYTCRKGIDLDEVSELKPQDMESLVPLLADYFGWTLPSE